MASKFIQDPHAVQKAGKGVRLAAFRRNEGIKSKDEQTRAPGISPIYETERQTVMADECLEFVPGMELGTGP